MSIPHTKPRLLCSNFAQWKERGENGEWQTFERVIGFTVVSAVYGVSDTEGPELPTWDKQTALKNMRINLVPFQHTNGNVQGYSFGRNIAINPVAAKPDKTFIHELAHVEGGDTTGQAPQEYHQGIREFRAEAATYIVLKELGVLDEETDSISRA